MNPEPFYTNATPDISRRGWWHFLQPYQWTIAFGCAERHTSEGISKSKEGCVSDALAADTRHAMHHARVVEQLKHPRRIRADEF